LVLRFISLTSVKDIWVYDNHFLMCESKVFLVDGDKKELLMEEAIYIKSDGKNITIRGFLGETRTIENARILLMDMDRHEVHIGLFR